MRVIVWIIGLTLFLFGSSAFAKENLNNSSSKVGNKKSKCTCPAPKYGGQGHKEKCNNGHGNNEDGVDSSNPGNSKQGEDSNPNVDDEKKSAGKK